jgi:uncharacterized protein
MDYRFEWGRQKALINEKRHKVTFEEAKTVFFDPQYLEEFDREENGEDRFLAIGFSSRGRILLVVVHTFRHFEKNVRII